jgi:hypothetical protein
VRSPLVTNLFYPIENRKFLVKAFAPDFGLNANFDVVRNMVIFATFSSFLFENQGNIVGNMFQREVA